MEPSDLIKYALQEDIGFGDITTSLIIPENSISSAHIIAKSKFKLAGMPFAKSVFRVLDSELSIKTFIDDGANLKKGDIIAEIHGRTHSILSGERTCLNILQRLSGIATLTSLFVKKIKGTNAKIVDTRKTTPCLRIMEKYAVKIGGGYNHRFGLFDGILIKDNHIKAVGDIKKAVKLAKKSCNHLQKIEVEVSSIPELIEAIDAGADVVMLDNMKLEDIKKAVTIADTKVTLEVSGNVTLKNIRSIAETGVDLISIGAITHSAPSSDISLKIVG